MNHYYKLALTLVFGILLAACNGSLAEVKITAPSAGSTVSCDTSQGDDQCYITVSGTATLPEGNHICLFLRFQGSTEGWIGGGPGYAPSGEWELAGVGAGELDPDNLPAALLITALITNETCTVGSSQQNPPKSLVSDTVQVHR